MMRMMMVAVVGMAAMVSIAAAGAPATAPADEAVLRMDDDGDPPAASATFEAVGTHTCSESGTRFTFTCQVSGDLFTSCAQAEASLRADDCCPRKKAGTVSTEFNMGSCSPR